MQAETIPLTECAKLIRAALKSHWPTVKFSVRSKSYSGGCSITVSWIDGPRVQDVDKVVKRYKGADFDGMTDCKNYVTDMVSTPEGAVKPVHYGADYVFTSRSLSDLERATEKATATLAARCTLDEYGKWAGDWPEHVAQQVAYDRDYLTESDLEPAFQRVALRNGA